MRTDAAQAQVALALVKVIAAYRKRRRLAAAGIRAEAHPDRVAGPGCQSKVAAPQRELEFPGVRSREGDRTRQRAGGPLVRERPKMLLAARADEHGAEIESREVFAVEVDLTG